MHERGLTARRGAAALLALAMVTLGAAVPNDPLVERQYHLKRVRAFDAWDEGRGKGQVIAVLDTGVDAAHPDLVGRVVGGIDLVDRDTPPDDLNGHGTFVAGVAIAAANNDEGGAGVAPRAVVMPVRVLDDEGMGTSDVVAEGIRWATREGATVINLSLADVPGQERPPTALITTDVELAIRQAALAGVLVVAAAGNEGQPTTPYNRDLPAIVVGATTRHDAVWEHSNYDDRTIFAPGVEIVSTYVGDPYAAADGTSFAAPIVAGGAALLLQNGYSAQDAARRLGETARPVGQGLGRVDIAAALGVAKPIRKQASPPAEEEATEPPEDDAEPRKPRPVTQPSPVEPVSPRKNLPPPVPSADPAPQQTERVALADPEPTEGLESPSPIPVPTAAPPPLLAGGPETPSASVPLWPYAIAGVLLFGVVIALGGYVTARRSS